jgi:hypothetical protein
VAVSSILGQLVDNGQGILLLYDGCVTSHVTQKGNSTSQSLLHFIHMGPPASYNPDSPLEQPVALPNAPPRKISDCLSIQPPLSRRGRGPGILLFLSSAKISPRHPKPLDPEPLQKWAEEGFTVAFASLPFASKETAAQIIEEAEGAFGQLEDIVDVKDKYAIVGELTASASSKRLKSS